MRITYDDEANAAYLYLVDEIPPGAVAETVPLYSNLDPSSGEPRLNGVNLDFDRDGQLLGIEFEPQATHLLPASVKEAAKQT